MKKLIIALLSTVLIAATILLVEANSRLPKGWFTAGNKPIEYEFGIDNSVFQNGKSSAFIKSKIPKENEFGTLMQYISAENYFGKRLRLSGYIKSDNVNGWCGMWMRIDGEMGEQFGFDNMQDRAIKGTSDWQKYEIVLDIPLESNAIAYGVMLNGNGKIWFDNFRIEAVERTVPVTNMRQEMSYPKEPINMDLEE